MTSGRRLKTERGLRLETAALLVWNEAASFLKWLVLAAITVYQKAVSPAFPPSCRFYPSCSCYARQAVEKHGAARGLLLAARRLARCHPFCEGGYDPVP